MYFVRIYQDMLMSCLYREISLFFRYIIAGPADFPFQERHPRWGFTALPSRGHRGGVRKDALPAPCFFLVEFPSFFSLQHFFLQ